jgi:hypothetical protein
MTAIELKYNLFKVINEIDDIEILTEIKNLLELNLQKGKRDFWDELTSEQNEEINFALKESLVADKLIPNSKIFGEYKK